MDYYFLPTSYIAHWMAFKNMVSCLVWPTIGGMFPTPRHSSDIPCKSFASDGISVCFATHIFNNKFKKRSNHTFCFCCIGASYWWMNQWWAVITGDDLWSTLGFPTICRDSVSNQGGKMGWEWMFKKKKMQRCQELKVSCYCIVFTSPKQKSKVIFSKLCHKTLLRWVL